MPHDLRTQSIQGLLRGGAVGGALGGDTSRGGASLVPPHIREGNRDRPRLDQLLQMIADKNPEFSDNLMDILNYRGSPNPKRGTMTEVVDAIKTLLPQRQAPLMRDLMPKVIPKTGDEGMGLKKLPRYGPRPQIQPIPPARGRMELF